MTKITRTCHIEVVQLTWVRAILTGPGCVVKVITLITVFAFGRVGTGKTVGVTTGHYFLTIPVDLFVTV